MRIVILLTSAQALRQRSLREPLCLCVMLSPHPL